MFFMIFICLIFIPNERYCFHNVYIIIYTLYCKLFFTDITGPITCARKIRIFFNSSISLYSHYFLIDSVFGVRFRVKAPVARRPPHRPVLEDFPHTVPRFRLFSPSRQPIRRHPDWRITLLPCKCSNIMDYSGARQGERPENSSELLMTYVPIPVASAEPASPRFFSVFVHHL